MKHTKFSITVTMADKVNRSVEMYCWAQKQFGRPGQKSGWLHRLYKGPRQTYGKNRFYRDLKPSFYFRNKRDYDLFVAKWS